MRKDRDNLRFLDDIAKVATGALGSLSELRGLVQRMVKSTVDNVMGELDIVSRADFERVEGMARKARQRQEELEERLDALEARIAPAKKPVKNPVKKAAKQKQKTKTKTPAKAKRNSKGK